jgi:hypothetical protein
MPLASRNLRTLWRAAELHDLVEVRTILLHQLQRMGLEHFHRLDVNVAVGDQGDRQSASATAAFYQAAATLAAL